jgi:hypothetical protein
MDEAIDWRLEGAARLSAAMEVVRKVAISKLRWLNAESG